MICPDCQAAAAHMRQGDTPGAAALHALCPSNIRHVQDRDAEGFVTVTAVPGERTWCDCQHSTGEGVNRALTQLETRRDVRP